MKLVYIESPFAGDVAANTLYARAAMRDSIQRGEAPFASHLLYTQPDILDDEVPTERRLGIAAGLMWAAQAEATVVYDDLGISEGMALGIRDAQAAGRNVEFRRLNAFAEARVVHRRKVVEDLRAARQWAEMSDDHAYTNGSIALIDLDIAKAEGEARAAEDMLATVKAAREAETSGSAAA
jgi:hypothetical protein